MTKLAREKVVNRIHDLRTTRRDRRQLRQQRFNGNSRLARRVLGEAVRELLDTDERRRRLAQADQELHRLNVRGNRGEPKHLCDTEGVRLTSPRDGTGEWGGVQRRQSPPLPLREVGPWYRENRQLGQDAREVRRGGDDRLLADHHREDGTRLRRRLRCVNGQHHRLAGLQQPHRVSLCPFVPTHRENAGRDDAMDDVMQRLQLFIPCRAERPIARDAEKRRHGGAEPATTTVPSAGPRLRRNRLQTIYTSRPIRPPRPTARTRGPATCTSSQTARESSARID
mmetsp:Transcript_13109/g.32711  ORF Transcript_13109/g.32711 Transcript_13109/m.32711 type:complete len:283 (+) Transcript_13109:375-1223(+)